MALPWALVGQSTRWPRLTLAAQVSRYRGVERRVFTSGPHQPACVQVTGERRPVLNAAEKPSNPGRRSREPQNGLLLQAVGSSALWVQVMPWELPRAGAGGMCSLPRPVTQHAPQTLLRVPETEFLSNPVSLLWRLHSASSWYQNQAGLTFS